MKRIASFDQIHTASSIDDVLDYMVYFGPEGVVYKAVHDHFLLVFFSTLPDFGVRRDFTEQELATFKASLPWSELGLNGLEVGKALKPYRSITRTIDELIKFLSDDKKKEIAREHLKSFWYEQTFKKDLQAMVAAMNRSFWSGNSSPVGEKKERVDVTPPKNEELRKDRTREEAPEEKY